MSRTHKHERTGAKAASRHCRNHGSCSYCKDNRTFFDRKHRLEIPSIQEAEDMYWDKIMYDDVQYVDEIGETEDE